MYKFKIINGNNQSITQPPIDLMFNKISPLQEENIILKNEDITTLIITDTREQNILGGMSLVKRELNHLQEDIERLIPTGIYREYVWECSNIGITHSQNLNFYPFSSEQFSRHFYRSLYEALVAFGQQKDIGFVIVKLAAEAYLPTKDFGSWPYIVEFPPREFSDNLFYGILPLKGCFYEEYQKNWKALDKDKR